MTTEQQHTLATKNQANKAARELTGPAAAASRSEAAPKVGTKRAAPDIDDYVRRDDYEFIKQMLTKHTELTTLFANMAARAPVPPQKEDAPAPEPPSKVARQAPAVRRGEPMTEQQRKSMLVADELEAMLYKGEGMTQAGFQQVVEAVEKEAGVTILGEVTQPLCGVMAKQRADESDGAFLLRLTAWMRLCVHRGTIKYPEPGRANKYSPRFHLHLFRFFALIEDTGDKLKAEPQKECRLRSLRAYMKEVLNTTERIMMCVNQLAPLTEDTAAARKEIRELGAMLAWYHLSIKCYNNGTVVTKSNGRKPKTGIASLLEAAARDDAKGDDEEDAAEEDADKEEEEK
jgi:hypothetical protein